MSRLSFLHELIIFLGYPKPQQSRFRVIRLWQAFSVSSLLTICAGGLIQLTISYLGIEVSNSVQDFVGNAPWFWVSIFILVIAPVLEELLFRLPLTRSHRSISLWLGCTPLILWFTFDLSLAILLLFGIISGGLIQIITRISKSQLDIWITRLFPGIIYLSIISFGLVHLGNYQDLPFMQGGALIFIVPQLLIGAMLAYTRVYLGFISAVVLHALHNMSILIPVLILQPMLDILPHLEDLNYLTPEQEIRFIVSGLYILVYIGVVSIGVLFSIGEYFICSRRLNRS